jgi:PAS domain-containing protein
MAARYFPSFIRFMKRLALVVRHLGREGVFWIVLGLAAILLGVIAGRAAILSTTTYSARLKEELLRIARPTEPRTTATLGGLEALALAPVNDQAHKNDVEQSEAFRQALGLVRTYRRLVGLFWEQLAYSRVAFDGTGALAHTASGADREKTRQTFSNWLAAEGVPGGPTAAKEYERRFGSIIDDALPSHALKLVPTRASQRSQPDSSLGPSFTLPNPIGRSALLIPSVVIPDIDELGRDSKGVWTRLPFEQRVEIALARLYDLALAIHTPREETIDSTLVQTYFIGKYHTLDLSLGADTPEDMLGSLTRYRYWSASNYCYAHWASNISRYTTKPYIDYAGAGVVMTTTWPITAPDALWLGAVGADFRMPLKQYIEALARHTELLQIWEVKAPKQGRIAASDIVVRKAVPARLRYRGLWSPKLSGPLWEDGVSSAEANEIAAALTESARDDAFTRELTPVGGAVRGRFFLPLESIGGDRLHGLLLQPVDPSPPNLALIAAALGIIGIAVGLTAISFGLSQAGQYREAEERRSLLRGLQVGVLRVDRRNVIVEANDRAEEILAFRLPKTAPFHRAEQGDPIRFEQVIEDRVVIPIGPEFEERARVDVSGPLHEFVWGTYAHDVRQARSAGRITEYYARVKRNAKVVHVMGGPLYSEYDSVEGYSEAWGIIDEVGSVPRADLEHTFGNRDEPWGGPTHVSEQGGI